MIIVNIPSAEETRQLLGSKKEKLLKEREEKVERMVQCMVDCCQKFIETSELSTYIVRFYSSHFKKADIKDRIALRQALDHVQKILENLGYVIVTYNTYPNSDNEVACVWFKLPSIEKE